jgi:hypothetical protein
MGMQLKFEGQMASHQHQTSLQEGWSIEGSFEDNTHHISIELNSYDYLSCVIEYVL